MTKEERWEEIEARLDSIKLDVEHRSYEPGSVTGVDYILLLAMRNIARITELLLEEALDG